MTPESFADATEVKSDDLEFATIITTEPAFKTGRTISGLISDDNHLRAIVDKRTGATRYEVHQFIHYHGPRRTYTHVHYRTFKGLEQARLTLAEHGADTCPNSDTNGDCMPTKRLAFELDEASVRDVAASYRRGEPNSWTFKLKGPDGQDVRAGIITAEFAGLIRVVDRYRAQLAATDQSPPEQSLVPARETFQAGSARE